MAGRVTKYLPAILVLGFLFAMMNPVRAEVSKNVSVRSIFDNNAFGDVNGESDYLTQVTGSLSWWDFGELSEIQYYLSGDGFMFARTGQRTFTVAQGGASYVRRLGKGRNRIFGGLELGTRIGRSDYQIYDYVGARGYLSLKWYLRSDLMVRTGYTLRKRNYHQLNASGFSDHSVFVQVNRFFPSRTTLRGDLGFGYKSHDGSEGQIVLGIQAAQSLTVNTGMSLRYQARMNTHAVKGADAVLFDDADLLNDRYDYGGHELTARLTRQLPLRMRLVMEGGYEIRNYEEGTSQEILGLITETGLLRRDKNSTVSFALEKPLGQRIQSRILYGFQKNSSNDIFYDYTSRHSLSIDFEVGF